jgi:hypothetical protein
MAEAPRELVGALADNPAEDFAAVTKSDTVNYLHSDGVTPKIARGLYVGGAGIVVLVSKYGVAVTFTAVPAGTILPCKHIRVNSTTTDATNMVALF